MLNTRRAVTAFAAAAAIAAQASARDLETHYRYDFEITVVANNFSGSLGTIGVGTVGRLTYLVDPDPDAFDLSDDVIRFYRTLAIEFEIEGFQAAGTSTSYPSPTFANAFIVTNDLPTATGTRPPSAYSDGVQSLLYWDDPEYDLSVMNIIEERPATEPLPEMLNSLDLPLSLDLSRATLNDFFIRSAINTATDIRFDFTDLQVTIVPAPASAGVLALAGLAATRRRR